MSVERAAVVAAALAAGADAVRIASALPLAETRRELRASIARQDLATWGYDDAYAVRASDPRTLLPEARSVICVALAYATPAKPRRRGCGRVSNYAWSPDYHRRMRDVLGAVAADVDRLAGAAVTAIACDTAPLAERAFAAQAGLGWIGKHTNLIAPQLGSFVFLGEIVTSLELVPDAPLRKTCGGCTRCIDVCPTGALRGDYTIDATRCISDLTQRRGPIPRALRGAIGDWVWGCDLCQDICPPTRRGRRASLAFAPLDEATRAPDLTVLLRLRSGEFKRRYAQTAMGWRGATVLRRNAAVALGNGLDRGHVPDLARALSADPHPGVRGHAAWALGRIASPQALAQLAAARSAEPNTWVRAEIDAALEPHRPAGAL
ncbi:MAG: tRNA epoxyqueuosine(34) reductase QueG [Candidatus Velthaea sp.]|jgi:epoxyqueuosine reductase